MLRNAAKSDFVKLHLTLCENSISETLLPKPSSESTFSHVFKMQLRHRVACARGRGWEAQEENQGVMGTADLNTSYSSLCWFLSGKGLLLCLLEGQL